MASPQLPYSSAHDEGDASAGRTRLTPESDLKTGSVADYTHDSDNKFPFQRDETVGATYTTVPRESVMSAKNCAERWQRMFNAWKVRDSTTKSLLVNNVLTYFIMNGASPRSKFTGDFNVNGEEYDVGVIRDVLGDQTRAFARAHADEARKILKEHEPLARRQAIEYGIRSEFGDIAFDFADYCAGLTHPQLTMIRRVKQRVLESAENYDQSNVGLGARGAGAAKKKARQYEEPDEESV